MRVLEVGLTILAKELKVPFNDTNWKGAIDQIEAAIKQINKTTAGPDWKNLEHFYSEAALQFTFFKNAWRNYVMHIHESYDEEKATQIFEHVQYFMKHLATRLKETP